MTETKAGGGGACGLGRVEPLPQQQVPSPLQVLGDVQGLVFKAAEDVFHFQLEGAHRQGAAEAAHVFIHVTQLAGHAGPPGNASLPQPALAKLPTTIRSIYTIPMFIHYVFR